MSQCQIAPIHTKMIPGGDWGVPAPCQNKPKYRLEYEFEVVYPFEHHLSKQSIIVCTRHANIYYKRCKEDSTKFNVQLTKLDEV